jgi:ABC-type phosphate transport system ATPase subunit
LSDNGEVSNEIKVLFNGLLTLLELIFAIFLEKKTIKNNKNSSIPSSQTDVDQSALGGSKGKGKSTSNQPAHNSRTVETVQIQSVSQCSICGQDLTNTPCDHTERRTKIDIVFEKVVEHIDVHIKTCPSCAATIKAAFPIGFNGPLQYGNGLKAYIINQLICQMVSLNRVQKGVTAMIGQTLSEATLLKFVLRLHEALEGWEHSAIATLLDSPAVNVDETSLLVNRRKHWIHVYAAGDTTVKCLHKGRGIDAINEINIIPRYGGVIIHDCLAAYFSYDNCTNALCGSHLLRELAFIADSNGYAWARNMKKLLGKACKAVSESENKCLTESDYKALRRNYRNLLTRGEKELPDIPEKPRGKRGKMAKSDAHNLWERLKKHESGVLLFAKDPPVSFTNNRAERDLRMAKVKQKVSGCFRTFQYAHTYCRISSYLQTMENKGVNPLIAIQRALMGI